MLKNNSRVNINLFEWDIDGTIWHSFNTPFANNIYLWTGVVLFLFIFQVIFFFVTLLWMIIYWIPTFLFWINRIQNTNKVDNDNIDREIVITFYDWLGWLWHGHEIIGMENIPANEPAVLIFYHGALAIDGLYTYTKILKANIRPTIAMAHNKEVKLYGYKRFHQVINYLAYSRDEVINHLNDGGHFFVSVGGLEESKISDNNYRVHFANRKGLAYILKATNTKATIIPIFSRNIQEAFWVPWYAKPFVKIVPKKYLPLIPWVGGLPVKLTTFIGEKIDLDLSISIDDIMEKIEKGLQKHIDRHQIVPGNRLRALRERLCARRRRFVHNLV